MPEHIFLAPRSNETSYDNLQSTIANGVPYSRIANLLDEKGKQILGKYEKVYAWGNVESLKARWDMMAAGDLVLFYARKQFVFAGRCLYKQFSEQLSDGFWPRSPRMNNKPWSCVFFLHNLKPVNIPLSEINDLGGYKLIALQGFQPLNQKGVDEVLKRYGSTEDFVRAFQTGITDEQVAIINKVTESEKSVEKVASQTLIDEVTRGRDLEEVIAEWSARNLDKKPEEIEGKVKRLKRCVALVKALKEKHKHQCQVDSCRFTFKMSNGSYYSEAAHIKPIGSREAGTDTADNILILCPNHHKMLDYGAMKVVSNELVEINGVPRKIICVS